MTANPTPINRNRIDPGKCVAGLSGGYGFPRLDKPCLKEAWRPTARLCATHEALWRASQRPADKPLKDNIIKLPTGAQVEVHPKALAAYLSLMPEKPAKAPAPTAAKQKAMHKASSEAEQIAELEAEGMTTSDAQAAVEADAMPARRRRSASGDR